MPFFLIIAQAGLRDSVLGSWSHHVASTRLTAECSVRACGLIPTTPSAW